MDADNGQLYDFRTRAEQWLSAHAELRSESSGARWGSGSDTVQIFHDLTDADERALLDEQRDWQRRKFDAGFGAISWPAEFGGQGLDPSFEDVFALVEADYRTPPHHELASVTVRLIAPTIRLLGTPELRQRLIVRFLRGEQLCCQLFSEPSAGSDLASLGTRATRDGDEWVINGQKVWSSGARFAQWGELLTRTDPDVPKHAGMTAFMLPMDTPGVEVRPLRQMSGGRSFCEVFLTDVRIPDSLRLGDVGGGWQVALTTLGFERGNSSNNADVGGSFEQVLELTRWLGTTGDERTQSRLAQVYAHEFLAIIANLRDQQARRLGRPLGPIGSVRKLQWVQKMMLISDVVSAELGPRLAADTGEWGTFAWTGHVLGAPGYRIAGGSDEVQRNIIAERMLGMPSEARADRNVPWRDIPR
jgi:alkylation response protein AidB-like acyl-CoA dehydrogenase